MNKPTYKDHEKIAKSVSTYLNQILVAMPFLIGAAAIAKTREILSPKCPELAMMTAWLLAIAALLWMTYICVIGWIRLREEATRPILAVVAAAPLIFTILLMGQAVILGALIE